MIRSSASLQRLFFRLLPLQIALFCPVFQKFLFAQSAESRPFQMVIEGHFSSLFPAGPFQRELSQVSFGGGGSWMALFPKAPLWAGIEMTHVRFDREKLKYEELVDGEQVPFEWRTTNHLITTNLKARYEFTSLPVIPFLEGKVGIHRFYTRTALEDEDFDEVVESSTDAGDWAFTYGGAAGLIIPLFREEGLFLELSGSYLQGQAARFYVRKEVEPDPVEDPLDVFEERSAAVRMFIPRLSLSVLIDDL